MSFNLRILSPLGLVVSATVDEVKLPGEDGQIGVLTAHTKYVGNLSTGVLEYGISGAGVQKVVVSGGFATFQDNTLEILADSVDTQESLKFSVLKESESELKNVLEKELVGSEKWNEAFHKIKRIESIRALQ